MNEKALRVAQRASAVASFRAMIGLIRLEIPISAIAASVAFCAAMYFEVRKPYVTGPA